jgi:RHS repeat-associated protein
MSTTSTQQFTGKERDSETGLDYFGARYFSSAQGRWTSPDKPFADRYLRDPQNWNLDAYGRNNALRYIDDNGEGAKEVLYGIFNATSTNAVAGIGRVQSSDSDVRLGQKGGDAISLVGSAIEIAAAGASTVAGCGAACLSGAGCLVDAPAVAGGIAISGHGILQLETALANLMNA